MSNLKRLLEQQKFQEFINVVNSGVTLTRVYLDGKTILHEIVDFIYHTALLYNIKINDIFKLIIVLLKNGADINAQDNQGNTPLHEAVSPYDYRHMTKTHMKLCRLLVYKGANLFIKNKDKQTPYEYFHLFFKNKNIIYKDDLNIIDFLFEQTIKISKKCIIEFLKGFDDKLGRNSSLLKYGNSNLFERYTLPIIFEYAFDSYYFFDK